jgi:predicted secreted Zn-dependent protease
MSTSPAVSGSVDWRVSRACDSGACVGVARQGEFVLIGDTSSPEAPVSRFTSEEWSAFVAGVKLGDFDDLC